MKAIRFFPTLTSYRTHMYEKIVRTDIFKYHPFYRSLIDFVIDHRAPLFFEASEESEYSHFTQYFNMVLIRDNYDNHFISDMFFMHDFVHMVFDNPINVHDYTFEYFCEVVNHNEYVASNETETLTYYRVPELREKSLSYTIMYDLLQHAGYTNQPDANFLLALRKSIVFDEKDGGLSNHPDSGKVFSYLRKFKENNKLWCKLWYENFPKITDTYVHKRLCLPILSYEDVLLNYRAINSEMQYEANVLQNIRVALQMIGETELPKVFSDCEEAVKKLEGKIIMGNVAKEFHELYLKNKNK